MPYHRTSVFGSGPRIPMCRERRAQFRALLHIHRRPGQLSLAAVAVARALHDILGADGQLDPSHAYLAAKVGIDEATVRRSLSRLQSLGFVTWARRLVRVGWRVAQTSNAYVLAVPSKILPIARAICRSQAACPKTPHQMVQENGTCADVGAARAALAARRAVVEDRLTRSKRAAPAMRW